MYDLLDPSSPLLWILIILLIVVPIAIFARPFRSYLRFVYPNAKYEAIGNPYVSAKELTPLLETKTVQDFLETLNTHRDYDIQGTTSEDIHHALDQHFISTINMVQKDTAPAIHGFITLFKQKHDLELIRHLIKARLYPYITPPKDPQATLPQYQSFISDLANPEKDSLEDIMIYHQLPSSIITSATKDNPFTFDVAFNRHILNIYSTISLPKQSQKAKNHYLKTWIDHQNILLLLRAKQQHYTSEQCQQLFLGNGREISEWKFNELADTDEVSQIISGLEGTSYYPPLKDAIDTYTQTKSIFPFEQALKQHFLHQLRDLSQAYYQNLGPLMRFLAAKEYEITNLKILAKAATDNLQNTITKPLLTTMEGSL